MARGICSKSVIYHLIGTQLVIQLIVVTFLASKLQSVLSKIGFDSSASYHSDQQSLSSWIRRLRHFNYGKVRTVRVGCREFDMGAQTCTFEGLICINTSSNENQVRGSMYLIDDTFPNAQSVPSDNWYRYHYEGGEPWWYGLKHWPVPTDTVAPRQSGLEAEYRASRDLTWHRIKWTPSLWLVDLRYPSLDNNMDLFADLIWILDAQLYTKSMSLKLSPAQPEKDDCDQSILFADGPQHVYVPHSQESFKAQNRPEINRLLWGFILQLNVSRINCARKKGKLSAGRKGFKRKQADIFELYPELSSERILLHDEMVKNKDIEMVCTGRLTAGPKRIDGAHPRVCEHLRQKGYELYGLQNPGIRNLGRTIYPQPPKRIVVVQRHLTRQIFNIHETMKALHDAFDKHSVEIELVSTKVLQNAEGWIRHFARAGVLISTHGSHLMGQIWMPRYSVLIEIMPVGYNDYAQKLLANTCGLWYYDLYGMRHHKMSKDWIRWKCARRNAILLNSCWKLSHKSVVVDTKNLVRVTREGLGKLGYDLGDWVNNIPLWKGSPYGERRW